MNESEAINVMVRGKWTDIYNVMRRVCDEEGNIIHVKRKDWELVTRCKDCEYGMIENGGNAPWNGIRCAVFNFPMQDDDYCSIGVEKDD